MTVQSFIADYGYYAVFLGTFLEGETILVMAGYAAQAGYLDLRAVMLIACIGATLGDQVYFFLGRFRGDWVLQRFPRIHPHALRFDRLMQRWHAPAIVLVRFMYGLRIVGPIMIGMSRVPAWRFLLFNFIGAIIWAILVAGAGYLFGEAVELVLHDMHRYQSWGLVVVAVGGALLWVMHRFRSRRRK